MTVIFPMRRTLGKRKQKMNAVSLLIKACEIEALNIAETAVFS